VQSVRLKVLAVFLDTEEVEEVPYKYKARFRKIRPCVCKKKLGLDVFQQGVKHMQNSRE